MKYEPGELKVVAYKNGKKWATDAVQTTGPAAKLLLAAGTCQDRGATAKICRYVTVTVADRRAGWCPAPRITSNLTCEGPGEIVAVDNGDATSFEPFQAKERNAFNGLGAGDRARPPARAKSR